MPVGSTAAGSWFEKDKSSKDKVICQVEIEDAEGEMKICGAVISVAHGSTSGMSRHISSVHGSVAKDEYRKRKAKGARCR